MTAVPSYPGFLKTKEGEAAGGALHCPVSWHAIHSPDLIFSLGPDGRRVSYLELEGLIGDVSRRMESHRAEILGLLGWNSVSLAAAVLAGLRTGKSTFLMSPRHPSEQVQRYLDSVGADRFELTGVGGDPKAAANQAFLSSASTMMLTSGSTGTPKIARHSARSHLASAESVNEILKTSPGDNWMWSLPAFHIGGLAILWRVIVAGACIQIVDRDRGLGEQIREAPPTIMSVVPTQLRRLIDTNLKCPEELRNVIVGGARISPRLIEHALDLGYPVRTTFGMTETSSMISLSEIWSADQLQSPASDGVPATPSVHSPLSQLVHAGRLFPCVEAKTDEHDILRVKGPLVFEGYVDESRPATEWWKTQDRVSISDDGVVVPLSRVDDMIISGGENIDPTEIENALGRIPSVRSSRVLGIEDARFGERPVAFVDVDGELPSNDWFKGRLSRILPSHSIPDHFISFPERNEGGLKQTKDQLRARAIIQIATTEKNTP